ncbi:MAG: YbaB/EbfC family nucleoid-associated protein [Anaerolineae bacterium]|nr:YbaB/EbfC family nucleoid-associated protein [Anaerolineae bacterium]
MAKGRGRMGGIGGAQSGMLRQLQSLQENVTKAQEEIAAMTVEATAGGGAVAVTVTGERRLQSIVINPDVVDPDDVEMLQDLVVAAVNQGLERIDEVAAEKMNAATGGLAGMGLPGLG